MAPIRIERLSHRKHNVLAELQAADGPAYRERHRSSPRRSNKELGLLPHKRDRRLLVSMPVAWTAMRKNRPDQAMQEQFGPLGRCGWQAAVPAMLQPWVRGLQFWHRERRANQWRAIALAAGPSPGGRTLRQPCAPAPTIKTISRLVCVWVAALVGEEVGKAVRNRSASATPSSTRRSSTARCGASRDAGRKLPQTRTGSPREVRPGISP